MIAALLGAAVLACGPAAPDEPLAVRDGPPVVGELGTVGADAVEVRTPEGVVRVSFHRIEPATLHALLRARLADPARADARFLLADQCLRFEAFEGARVELRAAATLDPGSERRVAERLAIVDERQAAALYRDAQEAMVAEDWVRAVEALAQVAREFTHTAMAGPARERLPAARAGLGKARAATAPAGGLSDEKRARLAAWIGATQAKAAAAITAAETANREGLGLDAAGEVVKAQRAWSAGVERLREAQESLARILECERYAPDPAALAAARDARAAADRLLVLLYLNHCSLALAQQNIEHARTWIILAMQVDPAHARALELKQKIELEILRRQKATPPPPK